MKKISLLILITGIAILTAACQPISIQIGVPSATPTQAVVVITEAPTDSPASTPEPTSIVVETPAATTGSVRGRLGYPSEFIPEMQVVAYLVGTDTFFSLNTELNQAEYQLDGLPDGIYHVVAYTRGDGSFPAGIAGGFTQAAACGMGEACTDHRLVDVSVRAGQVVENVDLIDWLIPLPPMPQAGQPVQGAITGALSYPSEFIPAMRVVAFRVEDDQVFFVNTQMNEQFYTLPVPAGTYHVVAYMGGVDADGTSIAGAYTNAVPCGLSVDCTDHTLIDVMVEPGGVTYMVDPGDFYAPEGTFPPLP